MEERNLICINCPMGCPLTVTLNDAGEVVSVTGNTCPRGDAYGRKEVTNPTRIVTSSLPVSGASSGMAMVSVKSLTESIIHPATKLACINDVNMQEEKFQRIHACLHNAFQTRFQGKSRFEL